MWASLKIPSLSPASNSTVEGSQRRADCHSLRYRAHPSRGSVSWVAIVSLPFLYPPLLSCPLFASQLLLFPHSSPLSHHIILFPLISQCDSLDLFCVVSELGEHVLKIGITMYCMPMQLYATFPSFPVKTTITQPKKLLFLRMVVWCNIMDITDLWTLMIPFSHCHCTLAVQVIGGCVPCLIIEYKQYFTNVAGTLDEDGIQMRLPL